MSIFSHAVTSPGMSLCFCPFSFVFFFFVFLLNFLSCVLSNFTSSLGTRLQRMISLSMQLCLLLHQLSMSMCPGGSSTLMLCWESRKFATLDLGANYMYNTWHGIWLYFYANFVSAVVFLVRDLVSLLRDLLLQSLLQLPQLLIQM